jgi:hypothetical protein
LLLLTLACTWISEADVDARLDQLDDDGDGFSIADGDCDDESANSYPGADELWYDGVNQDCGDEQDFDADGDGFDGNGGDDCNDTNPEINPSAAETWYDNIDQDCAEDSDFDSDQDGENRVPEGADCDDTDAGINSSAEEVWYDGVDADCDKGDDYDADLDGSPVPDDCDDVDPEIYPGALDTWYDGINSNCDEIDELGDYDQDADGAYQADALTDPLDCDDVDPQVFPGAIEDPADSRDIDCNGSATGFDATELDLSLANARNLSSVADGSVGYVSFLATSATDSGSLSLSNAAVVLEYDDTPEAGALTTRGWLSTSALDEGLDFLVSEGTIVGAAGLLTSASRSLLVKKDATTTPNQWSAPAAGLASSFNDTALAQDTDGSVHAVGCANDGIQYIKVGSLTSPTVTLTDYQTSQPAENCELYLDGSGTGLLGLTDAATGEYVVMAWDTALTELTWLELSREPGVSLLDLDWDAPESTLIELYVDQIAGQVVLSDGVTSTSITPTQTPIQASWDVNPSTGTVYVVWTDSSGGAGLGWGSLDAGFDTAEVSLPWVAKELTVMVQSDGGTLLIVAINAANIAQAVVIAP